jgi:hypothetical protein
MSFTNDSFWSDNTQDYPKHLQSSQFTTVWRGLKHSQQPPNIEYNQLGVHWVSTDKNHWATHFATSHFDEDYDSPSGTVIKARVPVSGLPKDQEEHEELSNTGEGAYEPEGETPIRPNTEVHVIGIERHTPERTRTFNLKTPRIGRS